MDRLFAWSKLRERGERAAPDSSLDSTWNLRSLSEQDSSSISIRQALPSDAAAIHALMRPFVAQRLLLDRTEAEIIELTRHGFVAAESGTGVNRSDAQPCVGFSAVEIYSPKLAELQCLAVRSDYQGTGIGRDLVQKCLDRARDLNVMEVLAISSSERFLQSCGFDFSLPDQKKALFFQLRPRHPNS